MRPCAGPYSFSRRVFGTACQLLDNCGRAASHVHTHTHTIDTRPTAPSRVALETEDRPLVIPPPTKLAVALRRASLGSKARRRSPPQPGEHEDAEAEETAARAARAGSLLSHPPRSQPCLTSCTSHKVCRAVWRTHTVGCPALAAGGEAASTAAKARVWRAFFSPRDTPLAMPTHTTSQLHMAHLAPHTHPPERHARRPDARPIRASRCVCLLCTPPFSHQCTRPAPSHGEAAPPTARHSHCTAACSSLPTARKHVARGRRGGPRRRSLVPLARPFCRTSLGCRGVPAASCAMHCTPLVQDLQGHAPHLRRRAHSSAAYALLTRGN
jgi:hypothetical protein